MVGSSDSDSDDDKRVVRSAKDRRFDELKGTCEEMRVCLWHKTLLSHLTCLCMPLQSMQHASMINVLAAGMRQHIAGLSTSKVRNVPEGESEAKFCNAVQNKLNINDWSSVQSLFDKLNKQMEKTLKAADSLGAPRVYIKMLVELEVPSHSCSLLCCY